MDRRSALKSAITVSTAFLTSFENPAPRNMRFAHFTDVHLRPTGCSTKGLKSCFNAIAKDKPDFIFNGGDSINECFRMFPRRG